MDEDNPPPSRPYRIRRPSSSLISSTTSPMFSAPPTPTLQPPPSPMAHHSRHRPNNNTSGGGGGAISQNQQNVVNNNFGPGDIDDDVQPSSSSSSFPPPSPRPRVGGGGSGVVAGFSRSSGPQSPLSSPDSTFWGGAAPSPSPVTHSYRGGPSTPGGMCVVSSSTVDDVPPSPFSPAEDISNGSGGSLSNNNSASLNSVNLLNNPLLGPVPGPSNASNSAGVSGGVSNTSSSSANNNNGSLPLVHHRITQLVVGGGSNNPSVSGDRHQQHSVLISQLNQDVNHQVEATSSPPSIPSASPLTFSISPLRNKIKKASSFERFSQAQAASTGGNSSNSNRGGGGASAAIVSSESICLAPSNNASSSGNGGISVSTIINNQSHSSSTTTSSSNNSNEQPISLPLASQSPAAAATSAIISRISWESITGTSNSSSASTSSATTSSSSLSSSFRSMQSTNFGDKSHIKIPSKKLAAKIASVFEQEQLNEAAAMAAASTNVIIPSSAASTSGLQHHHQGTSSPVVQAYLTSSQSQISTATANNSTLSQILNEAPAHHHHLNMGSLVSAEDQIMGQGGIHNSTTTSHENLIRELSESPLNLTESSSSNSSSNPSSHHHHHPHHHSHSQSQSTLPLRNPVISSRASLTTSSSSITPPSSSASNNSSTSSTSSSSSTTISKKIPLTPKQKLLQRIQSGTISPPLEPLPQPPPQQPTHHHSSSSSHHHQQQQVYQLQQSQSSPQHHVQQLSQQLQQQATISSALSSIQSASNNSLQSGLSLDQLQSANGSASGSHLILSTDSSGGPHSPNSQLDAYSYDALLRAREDLVVQEALGKIIEDPSNVNNMPYDAPEAYAYYQSILNDEIFAAGGGSGTQQSRTIQQQMSASLQDPNDALQQSQHQGQIEFVLGLSPSDEHDRGRADDLSLENDGSQPQFLDPNDALAVIKSHNQADSTLRNLLMMDSSRHAEDAWMLDYQNRILSADFSNTARSSSIRSGVVSVGGGSNGTNSTSVLSINGLPTSMGSTSWGNDSNWQRTSISSAWQHSAPAGSVDQDEVMDMSMIEPDKGGSASGGSGSGGNVVSSKRMAQLHAYVDQGMDDVSLVSDRDLANGLLQNMPISMPIDLQQPLGLLQSSNGSATSLKNALLSSQPGGNGIPLDLQQHHKILAAAAAANSSASMDIDDQPVNLMAAVNLEQELSHHSNAAHHHHHHQQTQHSAVHLLPAHLAEVKSLGHSSGASNDHSNQQGGSYTLQIHQQGPPSQHMAGNEFHPHHQLVEVSNLSPVLDNIDERRVIRVKKNKDNIPLSQEDANSGLPAPNFIPDKPIQPKSYASLPSPLQLVTIGNMEELAVFTRNKSIPPNTRFGPVEGSLKKACAADMDTMNAANPCLILTDNNNILWRVDREDDDCCNWMKFVRMAHSIKDQNALVSEGEQDGLLYFTTCKEIPPRTELQVGFSFEYAQKYGLPYLLPLNNSSNVNQLLDDEKMSMSNIQQSSTAMGATPTVIHGGSQNFLHQHLQKGMFVEESPSPSSVVQNLHHNYHHQQQQQHHLTQTPSVSPETTSAVLPTPPQQKSVIVETYSCFECDQEFHEVTLLQEHLDKMHKEPEIRRPKKKAIKKYQQHLSSQNSAVSTTAPPPPNINASPSQEAMEVSVSFSTPNGSNSTGALSLSPGSSERSGAQVATNVVSNHQSGKVDSSSQSNMVDSSDPMALGSLPMTKKRKAASSINAMNKATSSLITTPVASTGGATTPPGFVETNNGTQLDFKSDTVVSNSSSGGGSGGVKKGGNTLRSSISGNSTTTTTPHVGGGCVQQQVDGNDSDVSASQPPAKVKCTMCYKSFATKERLDRHMIVHSDEDTKPLKCPFCPKRFLTNSALAGHIKTHAEEGKCFECPICNFSTQQLLQLKEHVQTHKSRDSGMFHCPQCPKKFSAYSMIRKHIRAFHGPRQFGCEQCPMSFPTSDKLKLHKLKHSDHREFLCAECGRQFKRKDKLREHTKRIHETKRKAIELTLPKDKSFKKFIPKVSPEEYERFIYKCSECMVGFKRRGMLVNHLAKRHPEKPPQQVPELNMPIVRPTRNYFCLHCERVYKSSSKRKAHIIKAHPGKPLPPQARSKDIPQQLASFIDPQPLQPGTVVQTLTDDGNNTARAGVVSSAVSSSRLGSTVSTSTLAAVIRRETVVGKVVAQPHGCQWCHRQYATRAKLLQHQRKAHIHLMPPDMQMPRTQKNNVTRKDESPKSKGSKKHSQLSEQESVISSNVISKSDSKRTSKGGSAILSQKRSIVSSTNHPNTGVTVVTQSAPSSLVATTSSSAAVTVTTSAGVQSTSSIVTGGPVTTTAATLQALQAEGLPFQTEEGGLVGILVTPVGSNVELGNLVQGDVPIVMLTQSVGGSASATASALSALQGVNFSVLQAGQVTNLNGAGGVASNSSTNGSNASPNIISISNSGTTANLDGSSGIITINTSSGGGNNSSTCRIANVIQHHQSSNSSINTNHNNTCNSNSNLISGSDNGTNIGSSSGSSGVISATGKL